MKKPSSTEILLTVSAAGALVSGFLGHIAPIGITKASLLDFIDAFLGSVRYLVLDGFDPPEQAKSVVPAWSPWAIRVSRLFGVVFAAVGAWAILWRLFGLKDLFGFWWRVRCGRDLDLIIGVDAHGQRILADDKMNGQTIAIDLAPTAQARESCRRRRIPLLALDASTEQVVHRLSDLGNVKRVFVATNSDEVCAAIVHRLARHVRGHTDAMGGSRRVQFILRARSEKVLSVLLADLLGNHDIRIYTDEDSTARLLYQRLTDPKAAKSDIERRRFTRFGTAGAKVRHARLVLFGAGKLANAILLQHLHNDIFEREITVGMDVVCDDGPAAARRFVELHPCFRLQEPDAQAQANAGEVVTVAIPEAPWEAEGVLPRVHFHTLPPSGRGQREWVERHLSPSKLKGTDTNLIIVFDDPSEVIQLVLSIAPLLITTDDTCQPKFWAYVNSRKLDRTNAALQQEELLREFLGPSACKQVTVFTDYEDGRCAREELANDEIEQAAMKVHDVYTSGSGVREKIEEEWWKQGRQWHEQWERASSRHCGAHAWVKLGILQRMATSLVTGAEEKQTSLKEFLDNDAAPVLRLAEVEHRRWCASHLLAGWRPLLSEDDLRLPSNDAGFEEIKKQIQNWSDDDEKKKKERIQKKRCRRHLSLLPFESLKLFNTFESDRGNKEIKKDHNIARATIAIIGFVEEVRAQRVERKARAATGEEGSSG